MHKLLLAQSIVFWRQNPLLEDDVTVESRLSRGHDGKGLLGPLVKLETLHLQEIHIQVRLLFHNLLVLVPDWNLEKRGTYLML